MPFQLFREALFLPIANNLPLFPLSDAIRYIFYKMAGLQIEGRCKIFGPLTIRPFGSARRIAIGENTFVNSNVRFGSNGNIKIGRECLIGPNVSFETTNHESAYQAGRARNTNYASITVEDGVWIGAGAIILSGVTIGEGAVIAAGAVVNQDVPNRSLAGGVPARTLRDLNQKQRDENFS